MTDTQIMKITRDACKAFAIEHLSECAAEMGEWQDTAVLRDGRVRELAAMCNKFVSNHDGLRMAESFIYRAAVDSVAAWTRKPAAQVAGVEKLVSDRGWTLADRDEATAAATAHREDSMKRLMFIDGYLAACKKWRTHPAPEPDATKVVNVPELADMQIMRIAGDVRQRNAGVWSDVAFARAVLAADRERT
jgi:hypothetical protein